MKKILLILSIILLSSTLSQAQVSRNNPVPDGQVISLKIYPNPATTYITFDFQKGFEKGLLIQVYNFLGKKMYETQDLSEKTTLDLSEYNRGVYIFHLVDRVGKIIESGKFQVSK
ncbi:MAG: T9SS type A sorting domain-containing protein [Bacteroidetes bacterium]|nr:T9SS type A sorting domain-containing protein [Bacteroidota bacterium]MBS1632885.1 T9SS type A sorting domain-containing protein [Bacteroidota bacterium]